MVGEFECGGTVEGPCVRVGCGGECVVGGVGVAGGLSAEGAGLGVELECDGARVGRYGPTGHLDELPH